MRSFDSLTSDSVASFAAMSFAPSGGAPGTEAAAIFSAGDCGFSEQPAAHSAPVRPSAAEERENIVMAEQHRDWTKFPYRLSQMDKDGIFHPYQTQPRLGTTCTPRYPTSNPCTQTR